MVFGAALVIVGIVCWIAWNEQDRPLREVEAALKAKEKSRAMQLIGRYLSDHPYDARGLSLKGRVLIESGRLVDGIQLFRANGASDVADMRVWAKAHLLRHEWSEAVPILERILQLEPNEADSLHELTACRSYLGDYRRALESARKMATLRGQEHRAWLQIGTLHGELSNTRSAIEAWDHVLLFAPNGDGLQVPPEEFLSEFARVLLEDGQAGRAKRLIDQSLAKRETADARLLLGNVLIQTGDDVGAVAAWSRSAELAPQRREPREALANAELSAGHVAAALAWIKPVASSDQLTSSSAYLMQRICSATGDRDGSRKWQSRAATLRDKERLAATIDRALVESPESFWSRVIRAYRFAESGNWSQADAQLGPLTQEAPQEQFVRDLATAARSRNRSALPPLERLPITQH